LHKNNATLAQDVRLAAERPGGEQNLLWTPDARQDAFDNPDRATFVE